ncbi:MAG: NAD(P)/FAD-dependent oxidoreductase [Methylobacter sp.]
MTEFLIIGQGLAGSLLAWELIQRGRKVIVADNGRENASQVAAGLVNPVTGMRFVKSADVDTLLPAARQRYRQLGDFFGQEFYLEKSMLRLFRNDSEAQNAGKRLGNPEYQAYLGKIRQPSTGAIVAPFGLLEQKQTGYLSTGPLLASLKTFLIDRGSYRQADFEYNDLQLQPILRWNDITPKHIVFCEGHNATQNPWFSWLPFQPAKGEILTLTHKTDLPDKILNYGNWLVPLNADTIRTGATFDPNNLDTQITEAGKTALLNSLNHTVPGLGKADVVKHQANIRPCTLDKQPFIGPHPEHRNLFIFNGFGAKGSLQIPYYSRRFADALLNGSALPPACDIQRYAPECKLRLQSQAKPALQ